MVISDGELLELYIPSKLIWAQTWEYSVPLLFQNILVVLQIKKRQQPGLRSI